MNKRKRTPKHKTPPSYIAWRGEMLAKLALSRLSNISIVDYIANDEPGYDLKVTVGTSLSVYIEVKAFSSMYKGIPQVEQLANLPWYLPQRLLQKASLSKIPVILFVFDADSGHGRFLRLDNLNFPSSSVREQKIELPLENTITTQSLYQLFDHMRPPISPVVRSNSKIDLFVVFDTNAYLAMTYNKGINEVRQMARNLRRLEHLAGREALAHPIVIWELIAHLKNHSDPGYSRRLSALVALGEHAAQENGAVKLMADYESTICRALFDRLPPGAEQGLQNLGSLVTHITRNAPEIANPVALQNIAMLADGMQARENEWLEDMDGIFKTLSPEAVKDISGAATERDAARQLQEYLESESFETIWAAYLVTRCAAKVGELELAAQEIQDKARIIQQTFPVPFQLMSILLRKLAVARDLDLRNRSKKRWNFIWDSMITFVVGRGHIQGADICLITGDREILGAATTAGFSKQVVDLDIYLKGLGLRQSK